MTEEQRHNKNANISAAVRETRQRRASQLCRVYTVKIDESKLTNKQKLQLKMIFVEAKWIWNECVSYGENNDIFSYVTGKEVVHKDKHFNDKTSKLKYVGSQMKQDIVLQIHNNIKALSALKRKGNKVGKIKYTKEVKSINLKQYGTTYSFRDDNMTKLKVQNVKGLLHISGSKQFRNIEGLEFANAKILNKPDGYYLAIVTYIDKNKVQRKNKTDKTIGVDFGCTTSFTTSEGDKINAFVQESDRLKRLQRKMHRQKKGSKQRRKTIKLLRIEYQKLTNKKNDLANKIAEQLYRNKLVIFQDEQISNWKIKHGKKVHHSVLGRVKDILKRKNNCVMISKWLPTTKLCTECGCYHDNIKLSNRTFVCPECGYTEDRDIHAAKNMIWLYENVVGMERTEVKRVEIEPLVKKIISSRLSSVDEAAVNLLG